MDPTPPLCERAFEDPDELGYDDVLRGQLGPGAFQDKASGSGPSSKLVVLDNQPAHKL